MWELPHSMKEPIIVDGALALQVLILDGSHAGLL